MNDTETRAVARTEKSLTSAAPSTCTWLTNSEHISLDPEYHGPSSNMLGGSHGKENISLMSRGKGAINFTVLFLF